VRRTGRHGRRRAASTTIQLYWCGLLRRDLTPTAGRITGVVCGVHIEETEDPLIQKIRYLDKLVDELAKGKPLEKALRS
jgi:hypothetical protein